MPGMWRDSICGWSYVSHRCLTKNGDESISATATEFRNKSYLRTSRLIKLAAPSPLSFSHRPCHKIGINDSATSLKTHKKISFFNKFELFKLDVYYHYISLSRFLIDALYHIIYHNPLILMLYWEKKLQLS